MSTKPQTAKRMMTGSRSGPRSPAILTRMLPGAGTKCRDDGRLRHTQTLPARQAAPTIAIATRQFETPASRPPASRPLMPPSPVPLM